MKNSVAKLLQVVARCTPYTRCNVQRRGCFTYVRPCKKAAIGSHFLQALIAVKINFVAALCRFCCSPFFLSRRKLVRGLERRENLRRTLSAFGACSLNTTDEFLAKARVSVSCRRSRSACPL
jgi:hypothetical protein